MSGKWVHPAWKALGIAPTGDTRAIRVAYAAKLKAIDPEQDPRAFIALREAFEAARVQAQWVDVPDDEEDEYEAWDTDADDGDWAPPGDLYQIRPAAHAPAPPLPDPAWETSAPPEPAAPAEPPRASPWTPPSAEDADAHARALATLLHSHDREANPWPSPAQEAEMLAHWRAVIADPRMQEVSYFADAERWFAELIARTAAFSDPLVIPATEYFHWLGSDGTITQSPAAAYLTRRYRMLEFQRSVKQAQHPLNSAWRELVRPAGPRPRRGMANGGKVRQLLRIVRTHYPDLEGCFDPERVALWDGTQISAGIGWSWVGPALFFGFLILRFFASIDDGRGRYDPPQPTSTYEAPGGSYVLPPDLPQAREIPPVSLPPPSFSPVLDGELQAPDADLDQALERLFADRTDIATIASRDPRLYKALTDFWALERAAHVRKAAFTEDLRRFLARRYPGSKGGPPPLPD